MTRALVSEPLSKKSATKARSSSVSLRYRLAVVSRILAAVVGGYLLAALVSICLAQFLPLPRAEGVVLGMTVSFLFYLSAVIWCFACRSAWRAWGGLLLPISVLALLSVGARWLS